jgi:hypothetical protein
MDGINSLFLLTGLLLFLSVISTTNRRGWGCRCC